jgi:hypothetical protein
MTSSQRLTPLVRFSLLAALALLLTLPSAAQVTNGVKLLKGIVSDMKTGKPINGGKIWIYEGANSEPVSSSKVNPGTGFYQVILNPSTTYKFQFKSPSYYITTIEVTTPPGNDYEETEKNFTIEPIPIGSTIFSGRLFEPGSAQLQATADIQKVVDLLKRERGIMITVKVTPDALVPVSRPVTAAPKKPAKKGKKGATTEPAVTAPPPTPAFTEEQFKALAQERSVAVKNFMKEKEISVTRLSWETEPSVLLQPGKPLPDNVTITIKKIEVEDDE